MIPCLAVLAAVPAGAQPGDYGLREDSAGIAADAVPLPVQRLATECDPIGLRVLRDTADLRAVERFRGCEASQFPALGRDLYVHVLIGGDCHARFGVDAYRSAARREYRVVMVTRYGGCRAGGRASFWIRLPPLPDGWNVAFTRERVQRWNRMPHPRKIQPHPGSAEATGLSRAASSTFAGGRHGAFPDHRSFCGFGSEGVTRAAWFRTPPRRRVCGGRGR